MKNYLYKSTFLLAMLFVIGACEEKEYETPAIKPGLQNDCIKRTLGPNIAGLPIDFAYAAALPPWEGNLAFMRADASVPGAAGTTMDNNTYYTNSTGVDVPILIGEPAVTSGSVTEVVFNTPTPAATLRYTYIVPPEAKGQTVRFNFSTTDSQGRNKTLSMGPYKISNMDIALDINLSNNTAPYISIEDMKAYTAAEAAANPGKIDLVYLYRVENRTVSGVPNTNVFGHALVAPAADPTYLPGVTLPAGVSRNTKISKTFNLRDFHLARTLASSVYVDDIDFQKLNLANAPNYVLNLRNPDGGAWVETEDGKYRAFIYVNTHATGGGGTMRISMKRYTMF